MAHELTFKDGRAQMFSVLDTPWHREGHVLSTAPSYEEALELAGLRYIVEKRPTYRRVTVTGLETGELSEPIMAGEDGELYRMVQNPDIFTTVRTDTGASFGSVGSYYRPLQNEDAFRVLTPLLDEGVAKLETGGSLREGADAWLMIRFDIERFGPIAREVFGEEVIPFGLVANNHNGRRGVMLSLTPIRVVCANTLGAAELSAESGRAKAIMVKHTEAVEERVVEAAEELFAGIVKRYEVVARAYRALKAATVSEAEFKRSVLDVVAPDPRHNPRFNPDAKLAESVLLRAQNRRALIRHLWENGKGHTGDHSAWEAYNAAVEAIDHHADLWPTRGGSWRTASMLDGHIATLKDNVLNSMLALSA